MGGLSRKYLVRRILMNGFPKYNTRGEEISKYNLYRRIVFPGISKFAWDLADQGDKKKCEFFRAKPRKIAI